MSNLFGYEKENAFDFPGQKKEATNYGTSRFEVGPPGLNLGPPDYESGAAKPTELWARCNRYTENRCRLRNTKNI